MFVKKSILLMPSVPALRKKPKLMVPTVITPTTRKKRTSAMLKRTSLAVTLVSLITAGSATAQEYYSTDRTGSRNMTTISFGTANQDEGSSDANAGGGKESVVNLAVEEDDEIAEEAATIAELREQVKLMSLRLRELENDVAKKVKTAKKSASKSPEIKYKDTDNRLKLSLIHI